MVHVSQDVYLTHRSLRRDRNLEIIIPKYNSEIVIFTFSLFHAVNVGVVVVSIYEPTKVDPILKPKYPGWIF